jgi:hypothetical protein
MGSPICLTKGCGKQAVARGLCNNHYQLMRNRGLLARITPLERFMAKVSPEPTSGCWLWTGALGMDGYGIRVHLHGEERKPRRAHRASWEIFRGPIPDGLWVLHRCDNPPCVNPDHLFLGTQTDNIRDAVRKGRRNMHLPAAAVAAALKESERRRANPFCVRGHARTPENIHVQKAGGWECLKCRKIRAARAREMRKARAA